ncbi:MAG: hypothetical protein WAS07_11910 [Micropruina sp.]
MPRRNTSWIARILLTAAGLSTALTGLIGCTLAPQPAPPPSPSKPASATPSTEPEQLPDVDIGPVTTEEAFSSTTVSQWVKQADFVAVVQITSEAQIPPAQSEIKRREGLIMRTLTATVEQLVWRHPTLHKTPPTTFSFITFGWAFKDGLSSQRRTGAQDQPYLLPGHTYLMAIRWFEWGCPGRIDPQDKPSPPTWAPLGSGAVTPYEQQLGRGEFEGRWTEDAAENDPPNSFRRQMQTRSIAWVQERLTQVATQNPHLRHSPGPIDCVGE